MTRHAPRPELFRPEELEQASLEASPQATQPEWTANLEMYGTADRSLARICHPSPLERLKRLGGLNRQEPSALAAHAGDLCGGCRATGVPTATRCYASTDFGRE